MFDESEGKVVVPPTVKAPAPNREEMDAAGEARRTKMADQMGLKGADRVNAIFGKTVIRPPKTGGSGGPKMGTPEQFKQVTRQTQAGYAALEEKLKKAVADAKKNPDIRRGFIKKDENGQPVQGPNGTFVFDPDAEQAYLKNLYDAHEEAKRQLQNSYNQQIVDLGGSIAEPQQAAPAKQPPAAKAAPAALPAPVPNETVVNGYKYVGGNPNDKASWVPVK